MSTEWLERHSPLTVRTFRPRTREILGSTPPAARLDRPLWVFRCVAGNARRYDLLGFSREALLWVDASVPSNNEISAPGSVWSHRTRSNAFGVRDALLVLVEALCECNATCITHEDCVEATLKEAFPLESLALRCARSQLARLAISLPRALQAVDSIGRVRDERRIRRVLRLREKGVERGEMVGEVLQEISKEQREEEGTSSWQRLPWSIDDS